MLDSHEITKSLPPPRDDEPPSLRQDIIDEIHDHIECGVRRELLVGGGDDVQAYERVLKKFGDPHQVARRLWFQAMWSKIMTQRLAIGSLICSMVVSITMAVMMGLLIGRMDQQQRDQQAFNIALIEKVGSLLVPPVAAAPRDPDWNHLQIKLTSGSEDGPPATGVVVEIFREPRIGEALANRHANSINVDPSGLADCGRVEAGKYRINVITAWGEFSSWIFTVEPGVDHVERVVIPPSAPVLTEVSLQVDGIMPGPKPKHLLVARFISLDRHFATGSWSTGGHMFGSSMVLLAIDTDRRPWIAELPAEMRMEGMNILSTPSLVAKANWRPLDSTHRYNFPANQYRLAFERVALNNGMTFGDQQWRKAIGSDTYEFPPKYNTAEWRWQKFTAKAAEPNHWKITIPNEALEDDTDPSPIEN